MKIKRQFTLLTLAGLAFLFLAGVYTVEKSDSAALSSDAFSISGCIQASSGPLPGVTVSVSAGVSRTTDISGCYVIANLVTGTYTLTPAKSGWGFWPVTRTVSVPPDASGQDFAAISLRVYLPLIYKPSPQIANIEVTQAIQSLDNAVELIAGRPALVRVHIDRGGSYDARLYGFRGGAPLAGSPLISDNGPITQTGSSRRINLSSTLNFTLPSDWRTGIVDLYAELTSPDGNRLYSRYPAAGSLSLTFHAVSPLEVVIVPVAYHYGGEVYRPRTSYEKLISWTYSAYPLAQPPIVYPHAEHHFYADLSIEGKYGDLLNQITDIRNSEQPGSNVHYYGFVPVSSAYRLACGGMAWRPNADRGADHIRQYLAAVGNDQSTYIYGDAHRGTIMAHEMGHNLTRRHTPCNISGSGVDPNYPFPDGKIHEYGYDIVEASIYWPEWSDFMGYCLLIWTSEYTYEGIRAIRQLIAPATASQARVIAQQAVFQVSGWIRPADDQGHLNPAMRLTAPVSAPSQGAYSLELIDAAGHSLYSYAFEPVAIADAAEETLGFASNLPALPDAAAIQLWHGGKLLAELRPGSHAPSLRQAAWSRHLARSGSETLALTWQATDLDGDPLAYSVRYSRDGGTWQTVAWGLTSPAVELDPAFLPGGKGLLQVLASDGLHTAQVTLEPLHLPDKAPQVGIIAPLEGQSFRQGQPLTLLGVGWDLEDGALPETALVWESSRDGLLGVGRLLDLDRGLSAGYHTITLTARDSAGQTVSQTTTIDVQPR